MTLMDTGTKMDRIMPNRLDRGFLLHKAEYEQKALDVLNSGWYVLGNCPKINC